MVHLSVDGRLDMLRIIPPQVDETPEPTPEMDWAVLFEAAGLEVTELVPELDGWLPELRGLAGEVADAE